MAISATRKAQRESPEGRAQRLEQGRRYRERQRQLRGPRLCPDCSAPLEFHKMLCDSCRASRELMRKRNQRRAVPKSRLEATYGLSLDDLSRMLAEQGGLCAICGHELPAADADVPAYHRMQIDHDHRCCPGMTLRCGGNCVRGLVHGHCNRGVGQLGDDPEVYVRAAAYIASNNDRLGFTAARNVPNLSENRRRRGNPARKPQGELDFSESA